MDHKHHKNLDLDTTNIPTVFSSAADFQCLLGQVFDGVRTLTSPAYRGSVRQCRPKGDPNGIKNVSS